MALQKKTASRPVPVRFCAVFDSPAGPITVIEEDSAIVSIDFGVTAAPFGQSSLLEQAETELLEYFAGTRRTFTLPLRLICTPFQKTVIEALTTVPYGETISYGELARRIGSPNAARAVGGALNKNPLPIVYPCHRVVGANGALTGFGAEGGIDTKKLLLQIERAALSR